MKKPVVITLILLNSFASFTQGIIRGKITDNTGEALIGAIVRLKSVATNGVMADLDGNYSLKIADTSAQIIVVSYVSYKTQEIAVHPINDEVIIKDFVLVSSSTLDEVEVVSKMAKANNYYMENLKMKSSTTMDYISQETMKKTGDVSVVNAVARVSGVSSSSAAGFITVRGLGDRYIKTTINGSRIPTLDPFTNNIRLDLFPATLVDNIILVKTASPDLPGDWAGAYLSVETKDYPDKLQVNIESYAGYNPQSSFKDVISSQRSSTDWLGFDNGFRNHANNAYGPTSPLYSPPTDYQTFVVAGLGNYYHSIGVTQSWNPATNPAASTYFNLGLVQLGLLQNSQLNDPSAIAAATTQFNNGPYKSQAFNSLNAPIAKLGQSFADNWNTTVRKAPPNLTQSFSIGNQVTLFGRPLGFLAGFRYGTVTLYDAHSTSNRVMSDRSLESSVRQQASIETNGWSGLLNLAYKYNPNHSIGLLFMPNYTGTNNIKDALDDRDPSTNVITKSQFYEQRKQLIYQLKSEHYIPKPQLKIEANASYTNGKSVTPDFKDLQYTRDAINNTYQIGPTVGNGINRYYRYLTENLFDSRISAELPIGKAAKAGPRKLKFGGAYQYNSRKYDQYDYAVAFDQSQNISPVLTSNDLNSYFALSNFAISNNAIKMYYQENGSAANHIFGNSRITAGYVMTDYSIVKRLRFAGGLRVEQSHFFTDVVKFDSLKYPINDQRRNYSSSEPLINPGKLNNVAFLPSANLIFKLRNNDDAPINLRANFSQTVVRPSLRELSELAIFDFNLRTQVEGNANLKPTQIKNYDIRIEWYFKNRDNISASVFYKDFRNNIELVNSGSYSWQNVDKALATGVEIDGKKTITKNLDLIINVTLAYSKTTFIRQRQQIANGVKEYIPEDKISRPNFGQAPYIINAILSYNSDKLGLIATLSYNVQGARLAITQAISTIPDVYEMPRNLFDFKVIKKLGKHFSMSLTIKDVLNTAIRRVYKYGDGTTIDYDKYRYGTTYNLGVIYKL